MDIPNYTDADIAEKKRLLEDRFPDHSFEPHVSENLVIIEKCFGELALSAALSQLGA